MKDNYKDIIDLPHHQSARHSHMPVEERAAQFSPFAALTGYEDSIMEAGRQTSQEKILAEDRKEELDAVFAIHSGKSRRVLTYYSCLFPARHKEGWRGVYGEDWAAEED